MALPHMVRAITFMQQNVATMPKIAGVTTQKNAKGEITHITINMKKHGAALEPVLKEMGLMEKSQFDKECEQGISIEEARTRTLEKIKQWPWQK